MPLNRWKVQFLNGVVFVAVVLLVQLLLVQGSQQLYYEILLYYRDGRVGKIPLFVMGLMYYATALDLAFYFALALWLLRPLNRLLKVSRRYLYPPYRSRPVPNRTPIPMSWSRTGEWYALKLGVGLLVGVVLYVMLIVHTGQIQAPLYAESAVQRVGDGDAMHLARIISVLLSLPFGEFTGLVEGMEQYAIASHSIFIWGPAGLLTIAILNLFSFLFHRIRRSLYPLVGAL